jgi:hypothetical protein
MVYAEETARVTGTGLSTGPAGYMSDEPAMYGAWTRYSIMSASTPGVIGRCWRGIIGTLLQEELGRAATWDKLSVPN